MRPSSLIYILFGVLIFASYQILNQPRFPNLPPDQSDVSDQSKSDPPPIYKDESRLRDGDVGPANRNTDEPTAKDEAPLNGNLPATNQSSPTAKDEAQLDGNLSATYQSADLKDVKQNFSYLAYYAYSEVPPETKPADTLLKALEGSPRGTPVEEIKRVTEALGLNFDFMKAVAKIESDFNPKQRTGSYIGLFQLTTPNSNNTGPATSLIRGITRLLPGTSF